MKKNGRKIVIMYMIYSKLFFLLRLITDVYTARCESCSILTDALLQLRVLMKNTSSIPNNIRSRLLYKVDFNTNLILEWKKHQLRSVHQEKARQYALEELDNESVYVHMDWSMKFLPLKYREKMIDWFGKRGLCWHITHVVRLRKSSSHSTSSNTRTYEHRSFVHVFNNCTQNGPTVVSLLSDVFKRLKREDVQIKKAFVRSDNAGCFKGNLVKSLFLLLSFSPIYMNYYFILFRR